MFLNKISVIMIFFALILFLSCDNKASNDKILFKVSNSEVEKKIFSMHYLIDKLCNTKVKTYFFDNNENMFVGDTQINYHLEKKMIH